MSSKTRNQTAFVTGASSGMGKEIAERLLADGWRVYAGARRTERMRDLVALGAIPVRLDLTDDASIETTATFLRKETGGFAPDLLVNNAGYAISGPVEEIPLADARAQFEVHLFGLARLTQLLLPGMRAAKKGRIVNISSVGGKTYSLLGAWYHASKHALEGWSDCLRLEVADFGIEVVVIEPGLINTEFGDGVPEALLKRSGAGPYGRFARSVARGTEAAYGRKLGTDPRVVAELVARVARERKPRTRYAVGKYARSAPILRRLLGDLRFDRMLLGRVSG